MNEPQRVQRLRDNVTSARAKLKDAGFEVIESPTAICPIIVGDTAKAISMSKRLLELGVFVIGFGYPVVPEGEARLRVRRHTPRHMPCPGKQIINFSQRVPANNSHGTSSQLTLFVTM